MQSAGRRAPDEATKAAITSLAQADATAKVAMAAAAGESAATSAMGSQSKYSYATAREGKSFIRLNHVEAAASEKALALRVERIDGEVIVKSGGPVTKNGADIVSFNKETGRVRLWDAKTSGTPRAVGESKTFSIEKRRTAAIERAEKAINASADLTQAEKDAMLEAIRGKDIEFITEGTGNVTGQIVREGS